MPMTHLPEISTRRLILVSDASNMQFGTKCFWYQLLVIKRTCFIFVPVYSTSFSYGFSSPISDKSVTGISKVVGSDISVCDCPQTNTKSPEFSWH